jgi:hypothetical protein
MGQCYAMAAMRFASAKPHKMTGNHLAILANWEQRVKRWFKRRAAERHQKREGRASMRVR